MQVSDIYEGGSHQMRHCDPCEMPAALETCPENIALYSVTKHALLETRAAWNNPESLEFMRRLHQESGTLEIFESALQCIRCAEGITLIIDGRDTQWHVGGERAVGSPPPA